MRASDAPQATGIEVVATQPTKADRATLAMFESTERKTLPGAAYIVKVRTQDLARTDVARLRALRRRPANPEVLDLPPGHLVQGVRSAVFRRTQGRANPFLAERHRIRQDAAQAHRAEDGEDEGRPDRGAIASAGGRAQIARFRAAAERAALGASQAVELGRHKLYRPVTNRSPHPHSLLTGKLTGKFAEMGLRFAFPPISEQIQ